MKFTQQDNSSSEVTKTTGESVITIVTRGNTLHIKKRPVSDLKSLDIEQMK